MGPFQMRTVDMTSGDEFYAEMSDIQAELECYRSQFRDKIVFCNCDDPFESHFVKYFLMNFNRLGLNGLVAMGYPVADNSHLFSHCEPCGLCVVDTRPYLPSGRQDFTAHEVEQFLYLERQNIMWPLWGNLARDKNGNLLRVRRDVVVPQSDGSVEHRLIYQNVFYAPGDFRSEVSLEMLGHADIVVTAPPSSLLPEHLAMLMARKKEFLVLGNKQAAVHPSVFPHLKQGTMRMGQNNGAKMFRVPDAYARSHPGCTVYRDGTHYVRFLGTGWFTNLTCDAPPERQAVPEPAACVPGRPDCHCREQFEIIDLLIGRDMGHTACEACPSCTGRAMVQQSMSGVEMNGLG